MGERTNQLEGRPLVAVATVFAANVGLNVLAEQVSNHIQVPPWVLVVALPVGLALTLAYSRVTATAAADAARPPETARVESVIFCLVSLLIGAGVALTSLVPLVETRQWYVGAVWLTNYEVGAVAVVTALALLAARRRRDAPLLAAFIVCAVSGVTIVFVFLRPGHEAFATFIGWSCASGVVCAVVYLWPEARKMFGQFWGAAVTEPNRSTGVADSPRQTAPQRPVAKRSRRKKATPEGDELPSARRP